jgi:hypothetical protein
MVAEFARIAAGAVDDPAVVTDLTLAVENRYPPHLHFSRPPRAVAEVVTQGPLRGVESADSLAHDGLLSLTKTTRLTNRRGAANRERW